MGGAGSADQRAGPGDRHRRPAKLGEGGAHRVVDGALVLVLSEMLSKSPCSFPMISTTACDLANSRVSRWFSARSRPESSFPPADPVARCGR
jgi:hypothetical protein